MTFAQNEMELGALQEDGATLREHLQAVERITGKKPEDLERLTAEPCPPSMWYLWVAFLELNACRRNGEAGPEALSYTEIEAWSRLTRRPIHAWQVEVIVQLDQQYLKQQYKKRSKERDKGS